MFPFGVILGGIWDTGTGETRQIIAGPNGSVQTVWRTLTDRCLTDAGVDLCNNLNALHLGDFLRCVFLFEHPDI